MDQNWFFRWVWRFNALALALVLVAAGLALALPYLVWRVAPAIETMVDEPRTRAQQAPEYWVYLDDAREGRTTAVMALQLAEVPQAGFGSKSDSTRTVNYLHIDPVTGSSRWLFPTHNQHITSTAYLTQSGETDHFGEKTAAMVAVLYDVIAGDPSQSRRGAKYDTYVSKPDGTTLTKLISHADEAPSVSQLDAERVFVSYKTQGRRKVATIALSDFRKIMEKDIAEQLPN